MQTGRAAIMQPYVFPYLGYFHLIDASDCFVFYDDVHFKKKSWINRNRILVQGKAFLFTVPVSQASQNRLILDIRPALDHKWKSKFFRLLRQNYGKSPYFSEAFGVIERVFDAPAESIADLAIRSVREVYRYLRVQFSFARSSELTPSSRGLERAQRLTRITRDLGYTRYVNAAGGKELYSKEQFRRLGVSLEFVCSNPVTYGQYENEFVPDLSIIDVMMFNHPREIREFMTRYTVD